MKIEFKDEKMKALCENSALANKKLGQKMAKKLRTRLADLQAASVVAELSAGRPHPLKGDLKGKFALDLVHPKRLVFEPANDPVPCKDDKSIDWQQVTQIRIVWIGDYHD